MTRTTYSAVKILIEELRDKSDRTKDSGLSPIVRLLLEHGEHEDLYQGLN